MTKREFDYEMRKMDRRDQERRQLAKHNETTAIKNALRLYFSHLDDNTYVECDGGFGCENYLVEVSNPENIAGHKAEYLYADTAMGVSIEQAKERAKEVQEASPYFADEEIEVIDIDRNELADTLKDLYSETCDEFATMTAFIEHYMPTELASLNLEDAIAELVK